MTLSPQQKRVALLIGHGLSNKEAASELGVSDNTVKNHLTAIYKRLGVTRREGVVAVISRNQGYDDGLRREAMRAWEV